MIKINLANSLIAKSGGKSTGVAVDPKQLLIKFALIILPVIGVMFWEKKSLGDKKAQLESIQATSNTLAKQLEGFGSIDDMVRNVGLQKKDLDDKFNVIRQIFGLRSQKIQTLFALQSKVAPKTWLTQVLFHDKTATVVGYATTIDEVSAFSQALSEMQDLFSSVNTTSTNAEKVNGGEFFKFEIFIKLKE